MPWWRQRGGDDRRAGLKTRLPERSQKCHQIPQFATGEFFGQPLWHRRLADHPQRFNLVAGKYDCAAIGLQEFNLITIVTTICDLQAGHDLTIARFNFPGRISGIDIQTWGKQSGQ